MKTASRLRALAVLLCGATVHAAAPATPRPAIVLVHGALIDGSAWRGVYDVLTHDGYRVSIVQQPLTGLEQDVAATRRVLDQQPGSVILVGHSYGGAIITVAGVDPKVKALVYVAALQPDAGEKVGQAAPPNPATAQDFYVTPDGLATLKPEKFGPDFCADLPPAQVQFLTQSQVPVALSVFDTAVSVAAWHDKPSYFVLATEDRALEPQAAEPMAQRAGSKITRIKASHAVLISQPRAVARVIETAAREVR